MLILGFRHSRTIQALLKSQQFFYTTAALAAVLMLSYALTAILYLLYPNYLDHFEPTLSAISWLGTHGHPIYPDLRKDGGIYEAPYGPLLFITNGAVLQLFPTILGAKLAGWVAFLAALGMTYAAVAAKAQDNRRAIFVSMMIVVAIFSFFSFFEGDPAVPYWSRAEPFLILIGILTVIAASRLPLGPAAAIVGILAGFATDFKLHGALYAAPAALAILGVAKTWKRRTELSILLSIGAIAATLLPFLFCYGSEDSIIRGYISVLSMTAEHGLSRSYFIESLLFAIMLVAPVLLTWYFYRPTIAPFDYWLLIGLLLSLMINTVIASKPGAGEHHLLPLVPISVYGLLSILTSPRSGGGPNLNACELGSIILFSLLVSYLPGELWSTKKIATLYAGQQIEKRKIYELQTLHHQYPRAEVGLSDYWHYSDTFYRALLVIQGAPLHIDFASWMDFAYAGVPETKAIELIRRCQVTEWILPKGPPFTMSNLYTNLPLLSDDFRRTFFANYRLVQKGEFYRVWKCDSPGNWDVRQ